MVPSFLVLSSCHLLLARPLDLFPPLGCHSVQRLVHLLSFILVICSAHLYFCFSVYSMSLLLFFFCCLFSKRDCGMHRGISLLTHVGKMSAKVLEQRTRYKVEPFLSQAQMGFRKGRGCTDAIFALRQLSEKVLEHDRELNIVFVDQEKVLEWTGTNYGEH